jgi:anti-sigma-K factor RskA
MGIHDLNPNSGELSHHELHAMTGAYVLDALDPGERDAFETHLVNCAECTTEIAGFSAAATELSHASATEAPAQLRDQVLADARAHRPLPPRVATWRAQRRGRWMWPAVAAACALIALGGIGWGFQQHRAAQSAQHHDTAISSVLNSPDAATVSGHLGANGHATVVYSRTKGKIVLIARSLPKPPSGKTYQLWLMASGKAPASLGVFAPNRNGYALVQRTGKLAHVAKMGISVEPEGGSKQPTPGAIVATMKL